MNCAVIFVRSSIAHFHGRYEYGDIRLKKSAMFYSWLDHFLRASEDVVQYEGHKTAWCKKKPISAFFKHSFSTLRIILLPALLRRKMKTIAKKIWQLHKHFESHTLPYICTKEG